ncbi:serine/threonine-protein kinase dst3 [Copidosoma floridanum]|uniref:serine/threonine-protein kinase dst3 n=1 Tax=Copidosoma floridanum TaxID=29053 RepID=UPI0006C96EB5|nr:serine/threonine-protein kinase dst3 [Copidosoma floridanum]
MGVCVHEGQLHALTEYINRGSLEQLIMSRHVELPHQKRMKLARDTACGMAYLHSRGLFHRDLTSKNVLVRCYPRDDDGTEQLTAVVGDFGLAAKIPDPSTGYRLSTVGSPYWMSPECLKGQWYDHRSDVFSFGIVVCELIGRVPADPDVLPRSDNFGLDYLAVAEICAAADPPPAFLQLAFHCCTYEPRSRPTFPEIVLTLDALIANHEDETKTVVGKRQSVDQDMLMSSINTGMMRMIAGARSREPRQLGRRQAPATKPRSRSADARATSPPSSSFSTSTTSSSSSNATSSCRCCCVTGNNHPTPSDKARCHSARRVAELASRRDPHYRPMTANPFHALGGVKKILGDLFSSCLELPSLEDPTRPSVPGSTGTPNNRPRGTAQQQQRPSNDDNASILVRKKPSSEPSSPTARKKWEKKVAATKVGAATSLFAHPLFRDGGGWEPRRRGSCESGFWSCVGEDLSPEPPANHRRHASTTLSSSAASSLFLLDDHRTSSIYTDSSEDIASLGGNDSATYCCGWEERFDRCGWGPTHSKTIAKIVEYFERKHQAPGAAAAAAAVARLQMMQHSSVTVQAAADCPPSRIALLRARLEGSAPLSSISAAQRLVVCEGAVRSKLPLFDKK